MRRIVAVATTVALLAISVALTTASPAAAVPIDGTAGTQTALQNLMNQAAKSSDPGPHTITLTGDIATTGTLTYTSSNALVIDGGGFTVDGQFAGGGCSGHTVFGFNNATGTITLRNITVTGGFAGQVAAFDASDAPNGGDPTLFDLTLADDSNCTPTSWTATVRASTAGGQPGAVIDTATDADPVPTFSGLAAGHYFVTFTATDAGGSSSVTDVVTLGTPVDGEGAPIPAPTDPADGQPDGGAVYSNGPLRIEDSSITGNEATRNGGGIYHFGGLGNLTVVRSTISMNEAGAGGGIYIIEGLLTLRQSTVSGNTASLNNGGGGILAERVDIINSTIAENQATAGTAQGGGIRIAAFEFTFENPAPQSIAYSTVADNYARFGSNIYGGSEKARWTVENTVLADPTGPLGAGANCHGVTSETDPDPEDYAPDATNAFALDVAPQPGDATQRGKCGFDNESAGASNLDPLADYGGTTETIRPQLGSPVVNAAGTDPGCTVDQRGFRRPNTAGAANDAGAFERGASAAASGVCGDEPPSSPTDLTVTATSGSTVSLAWTPAVDDDAVVRYDVYRRVAGSAAAAAKVGETTGTSFTDTGLEAETTYEYDVVAIDTVGHESDPATITATTDDASVLPTNPEYVALAPSRVLDTRNGLGVSAIGPAGSIDLQVTGRGGVPASGVSAVVLNVTSTNSSTASFVTVWPTGEARPNASNLNTDPVKGVQPAGQDTPNLVIVKVGDGGQVSLYNNAGQGDLVADVVGYFPTSSSYQAQSPARVLDTRNGNGAPAGLVGPQGEITLDVTGRGGVPETGVGAVVLNVTSTGSTAPSFVTVWPSGVARPNASALNTDPIAPFQPAGQDTPNLVIVKVGADGNVKLYNNAGQGHLVADVLGWFPTSSPYTPLTPARVLDTRNGNGAPAGLVGPQGEITLDVTGRGGVPASDVEAVVLNVTSTGSTTPSFVTVWPSGVARPNASALNTDPIAPFQPAGQDTPNLVIVKVGADGNVKLYNNAGQGHLVADVVGYFPG